MRTLRHYTGHRVATESLVPVRSHHHDVDRPGGCEGDTVAHCGANLAGEFFYWTTRNSTSRSMISSPDAGAITSPSFYRH